MKVVNQKYKHELILIVLCIFMSVFMQHSSHPNLSFDDANYIRFAGQILTNEFKPLSNPYAYGYLLPATIALSMHLFGTSLLADALPSIIEYILLVLVSYWLIKKMVKPSIAFYTSFLVATSAFIAGYATRALPDMLIGLLVGLALYMVLEPKVNRSFTAGILIGMIIFVKLGAMFIPAILLVTLVLFSRKRAVWFLVGLLLITCIYFASIGFNTSFISNYSQNQVGLSQTSLGFQR